MIAHLNVRGLRSSADELKIFTNKHSVDVLIVSETWLNGHEITSETDLPGYNLLKRDRDSGNGGGVAGFIKNKFAHNHRPDLESTDLEAIWFELKLPQTKPLLIVSVDRPPTDDQFFDRFKAILGNIQIHSEFLVLGDFNCNMLQRLPQTTKLKSILVQHQMSQLIRDPTRISETSSSLLDLLATTHPEKILDTGVHHLSISDHSLVYAVHCARSIKKPPRKITFRNFNRFQEQAFRDDVQSLPLQVIESFDDPDLAWSPWRTMFTEICEHHAPLKTATVRGNPCPWMSNNVKEMMRRDSLHRKAIRTKSKDDWKSYKKLRNEVTLLVRKDKENYFKTQISNSNKDPMGIWSTLKKVTTEIFKNS